jgi:hypothetical protein
MKLRDCNRETSPSESQIGMVIDLVGTRVGSTGRKAAHVPVCANERSKRRLLQSSRIPERHRSTDSAVTAGDNRGFSFQSLVPAVRSFARIRLRLHLGFDSRPLLTLLGNRCLRPLLSWIGHLFILSLLRANQAVAAISMYNCLAATCFFSTLIISSATAVRHFGIVAPLLTRTFSLHFWQWNIPPSWAFSPACAAMLNPLSGWIYYSAILFW